MWLVFLLYALFASVFTIAKEALLYADPFFLVGSRMLVAGLLMLGYARIVYPSKLILDKRSIKRVLLLGFCNIYITNILELWGLKYLTSFKTCFIYSLSPFLAALISYLMLHETLTPRKWVGLLIGFLGIMPMLLQENGAEAFTGHIGIFSWAEIAVLGAVVASVIGWTLLKQLVTHHDCPPIVANGYSMLFGGILATIHSWSYELWAPIPVRDYSIWLQTTFLLILISNILCYNLYGALLKRFSPTFMALAGLSTPLFTALFGWIFHNEVVSITFFFSLSIVFVGLLIFYYEEIKHPLHENRELHPTEPPEILIPRTSECP